MSTKQKVNLSLSNQLLQEVEPPGKEDEEDAEVKKGEGEGKREEADSSTEESKGENPLDKYMKMVLQAREKQHIQASCTHLFFFQAAIKLLGLRQMA